MAIKEYERTKVDEKSAKGNDPSNTKSSKNSFLNLAITVMVIISGTSLLLGVTMLLSNNSTESEFRKSLVENLDMQCDWAGANFVDFTLEELRKVSTDLFYCYHFEQESEVIKPNVIKNIGGSGKYREDYFVYINNRFYIIFANEIESTDGKPGIRLWPLSSIVCEGKYELEMIRILTRARGEATRITSSVDYISLYKGERSQLYSLEVLSTLDNAFWQQIEEIVTNDH
jgi:hypothetical protein